MTIAKLALASTVAAVLGCAHPAFAQSRDRTGASPNQDQTGMSHPSPDRGSIMNDGSITTGTGRDDDEDDNADNRDQDSNWNSQRGRRYGEGGGMRGGMMGGGMMGGGMMGGGMMGGGMGPMAGRMGQMARRRQMMLRAMGGAHFHFARGNATIDVRCSVQEDTQACVRAAGELLDKIGQLRDGGRDGGNTNGAGSGKDSPSGGRTPGDQTTPNMPGERM